MRSSKQQKRRNHQLPDSCETGYRYAPSGLCGRRYTIAHSSSEESECGDPRSVFSHFVGSDSPQFDAFTRRQIELFEKGSQELQAAFSHKILRHICNTAGIERFPDAQFDMVRLGIGLYGVSPIDNSIIHNVSTLKTTILQIRDVPKKIR